MENSCAYINISCIYREPMQGHVLASILSVIASYSGLKFDA